MNRCFQLVCLMVVLIGAGAAVSYFTRSSEPIYQQRSLSWWLEELDGTVRHGNSGDRERAADAIRHFGTNALPTLTKLVRARDSRFKQFMMKWAAKQNFIRVRVCSANERRWYAVSAYRELGSAARTDVAALAKVLQNDTHPTVRMIAATCLGYVGSTEAVAALLNGANDKDQYVRNCSLWALSQIETDPVVALPVLIKALDDPFSTARENAANAIGKYGTQARTAVPSLVRTLAINRAAGLNLRKIDSKAADKAGIP